MASKLEQVFQTEIKRSIPEKSHYQKIPDMPRFKKSRFIPKKPYDCYCINNGITYLIENKVHKIHTAWSISKIQDHQIEGLLEAENAGKNNAFSFVFINVRYGLGKKRTCYIIVIHILDFLKEIDKCKRLKRKSIPICEFEKYNMIGCYRMKMKTGESLLFWQLDLFFVNNKRFRDCFHGQLMNNFKGRV